MRKILICVVVLSVWLSIPAYATFINGDMETWTNGKPDGWYFDPYLGPYINSVTATPSTDAHSGNYSAQITTAYSQTNNTVTVGTHIAQGWSSDSSQWIDIPDGGATVNFSAWFKFPSGAPLGSSFTLRLYEMDANNNRPERYEHDSPVAPYLHDGWNYISLATPDLFLDCDHVSVFLSWGNYVEGQTYSFLVDDVNLSIVPKYTVPDPPVASPEPSTILFLSLGLAGLVGLKKRA